MSQHIISLRTNYIIFASLMGLLVLTVAAARLIDAGIAFEVPIAMAIAITKAVLIMMFFMHLKFSTKLTWVFATAGTAWLAILISFVLSDFLSRHWLRGPLITDTEAVSYFGPDLSPESATYLTTFQTSGKDFEGEVPVPDSAEH